MKTSGGPAFPLFDALIFTRHPAGLGGTRAVIEYENGYGASVITGSMFYTAPEHPYELGVCQGGHLTYETPITSDVLGHLDKQGVEDVLAQIKALPSLLPKGKNDAE